MFIIMHCMGMPFNGATIAEASLGGSETAAYYVARELAARGHQVTLFTTTDNGGEWDGVRYLPAGKVDDQHPFGENFQFYAESTPSDVIIAQRHPRVFAAKWASRINLWWLHDLALYRQKDHVLAQMWNIDSVLTVSEYHKSQVAEVYGIDPNYIVPIRNGVDGDLFAADNLPRNSPGKSKRFRLLYSSRPERGLENLVKHGGVLDQMGDWHEHVELAICGYANTVPKMEGYYAYLADLCSNSKWTITDYGALSKRDLATLMLESDVLVYPTQFEEVSCITAMEAMAAGLPMITCPAGALPETCKGAGVVMVDHLPDGSVDCKSFAEKLRKLLSSDARRNVLREQQLAIDNSWVHVVNNIENTIDDVFDGVTDEQRLAQLLNNSDVYAATSVQVQIGQNGETIAMAQSRQVDSCYAFAWEDNFTKHYEDYYEYEHARGAEYGPETLEGSTRYQCVRDRVSRLPAGSTVLDYGCAHGHYTINLAKAFPEIEFIGIDINQRNIDTARQWATADAVPNARFYTGQASGLEIDLAEDIYLPPFALIIAAEVLEHVASPQEIICCLQRYAKIGCEMVITTPFGPWEADGFDEHYPWRAHVHHFDRRDLHEMWGGLPGFNVVCLPSGYSHKGELVGSYVTTFNFDEKTPSMEQGAVDYARKLATLEGRQRVSLCMIARNEEFNIGRSIMSAIELVDEVVVGVDKTTTDETFAVIRLIESRYPTKVLKAFNINSPLETGFAHARNVTIEEASGDWILWLDADEIVADWKPIRKYLRNSQYTGLAIPQHHFSIDPAAVIQTDLPVRLFRNRIGIKFFGVVHEHPEQELNKGVGRVLLLQDVSIAHSGYTTEEVRRARFRRNFSLMKRDRKENPTRTLGKHLWVRDVAQAVYYEQEAGLPITGEVLEAAREAVALWRELLDLDTRMASDSLKYYSALVQILGEPGAIDYEFTLKAGPGAGRLNGAPAPTHAGTFLNRDHAKVFFDKIEDAKLAHYDSRYF